MAPNAKSLFGAPLRGWTDSRRARNGKPNQTITFKATPLQVTWLNAVLSGMYTVLGIGGGIRGTKTFACLSALILLCRIFPRSRWAVVRKDLPTIRRNVLPSMEKLRMAAGGFVGELNQSTWSYSCANGSEIILFAEQFTQDPELERWKGLEVNGFDLEEASELNEKSANKAIERAGSWIIPPTPTDPKPEQPPPLVFANFNPCSNWPRKWFYEPWKAGTIKAPYFFLPATIADNPYATEAYKESLKLLPKEEYDRFVKGEWDFTDDPDQLIKTEWIWNARNVEPIPGPRKLSCDVARFGDDQTVWAEGLGNALVDLEAVKGWDTTRTGHHTVRRARAKDIDGPNVIIDTVGLGAGTADTARDAGLPVREFIAGAKAIEREGSFFKFYDLRSQAWWELREKLRLGLFSLNLLGPDGKPLEVIPEKLIGDLAAPRYYIQADRTIRVESKDDIKKRLGRSTDYGDAVVMLAFDFPEDPSDPMIMPTISRRTGR